MALRASCLRALRLNPSTKRHVSSNCQTFAEGDRVKLQHHAGRDKVHMTTPLRAEKTTNTHAGVLHHSDIIGCGPRDIISTNKGSEFRLSWPTLEEYVVKVPRLVTPVYPLDAAVIANLLDIHVDAGASPPLEIFEAGTGHGSLTLALARAVHAGNSHLPRPLTEETKAQRGAIIHTLDKSSRHSQQARDVVRGFRRGMYKDNVEFYVGDPSEWIDAQLEKRGIAAKEGNLGQGFLYAVVLDLPGPEEHLKAAADALINDGIVCVFCPSITQVGTCVSAVRQLELPLVLDKVLEFPGGAGTGAGLRAWDVRFAHVRSRAARPLSVAEAENPAETEAESTENKYEMVCRPTSFENFVGGGFFGMFRRKARGGEGPGTAKNLVAVAERAAAAAKATEEKIAAKIAAKAAAEEAAGKAAEETGEETVAEERIEEGAVEQAGIDTHDSHQK